MMPATSEYTSSQAVDFTAVPTYLNINGGESGFPAPKTHCQKIIHRWGENASEALCVIQLADLDSTVPAVAGVDTSPAYQIKKGDFASVLYQDVTLFTGVVTDSPADLGQDKALVTIKDMRWILDGVQFVGSWWADITDPPGTSVHWRNVKAHYNPNNTPNCIFVTATMNGAQNLIPFFCPPFFGITDFSESTDGVAKSIPDPGIKSRNEACYWTPANALLNALYAASTEAAAIVAAYSSNNEFAFYSGCTIPTSQIIVDSNITNAFAKDFQKVDRKAFERVYHCVNYNKLIDDLCKSAGPYAHSMKHNSDGTNTLIIGRTRYLGADATNIFSGGNGPSADATKGTSVTRAAGGKATNDMQGPTIISGQLSESAENYYSKVLIVGDHKIIGCRCASAMTKDTDAANAVPLRWGFSEDERNAAKDAFEKQLNNPSSPGNVPVSFMKGIFRQYPSLFCDYIVKPGFDFQAGTSQAGFPVAVTYRDVFPHCVSSYIPNTTGGEFARVNSRYPIPLENSTVIDDSAWSIVQEANGLQIKGRGIISLRLQRDQDLETFGFPAAGSAAVTFDIQWKDNGDGTFTVTQFRPKRIRLSLAIPCDHRLVGCLKMSNDTSPGQVTVGDSETDDSDRINGANSRMLAIDTGALGAFEERAGTYGEFPVPESIAYNGGVSFYPKAGTEAAVFGTETVVRDDSQYLLDQANRKLKEFGRLDRGGKLVAGRIEMSAQVFDVVDTFINTDGRQIPLKGVRKQVEHNFETGQTEQIIV